MKSFSFSPRARRAGGIALPMVLVILALMLIGGIYLLKAVYSNSLTTGNLAYDSTLSREADRGLLEGFKWLVTKSTSDRSALNSSIPDAGYHASIGETQTPRDTDFWSDKKTVTDNGVTIEYVIHRLCNAAGTYDSGISCTQTAANTASLGNTTPLGSSLATDSAQYAGAPRIHYVITSRITAGRGASVTNQMVVLIGA